MWDVFAGGFAALFGYWMGRRFPALPAPEPDPEWEAIIGFSTPGATEDDPIQINGNDPLTITRETNDSDWTVRRGREFWTDQATPAERAAGWRHFKSRNGSWIRFREVDESIVRVDSIGVWESEDQWMVEGRRYPPFTLIEDRPIFPGNSYHVSGPFYHAGVQHAVD